MSHLRLKCQWLHLNVIRVIFTLGYPCRDVSTFADTHVSQVTPKDSPPNLHFTGCEFNAGPGNGV